MKKIDIDSIIDIIDFDEKDIAATRERQRAFWAGEKLDVPPIVISRCLPENYEKLPDPGYDEIFYDADLMLCKEIRGRGYLAYSDFVPSVRANLGTGVLLSAMGLRQKTFPDKMPWLVEHLSVEDVAKLSPESIEFKGDFARGLEIMDYFKEKLKHTQVSVYCMDTQGPFDLAHLALGDEIFMQMYDNPALVHNLLDYCTELIIKSVKRMKEIIGEPLTSMHYEGSMYSEDFGTRICEDTSALLGAEHISEFVIPYSRRVAREFGGAYVHYCGRNDNLTKAILEVPELKIINFGIVPGKEYDHDFSQEMENIEKAGKIYKGVIPRFPEEDFKDYLKRLHTFASRGILFPYVGADESNSPEEILSFWQSL